MHLTLIIKVRSNSNKQYLNTNICIMYVTLIHTFLNNAISKEIFYFSVQVLCNYYIKMNSLKKKKKKYTENTSIYEVSKGLTI